MPKLQLPVLKEPIGLSKPTPKPESPKIEDHTTEDERAQVANATECAADLMLKRGNLSHPLIVQAREILGRSNRDGHDLLWSDEPCLDLSISKAALSRALRLAAALITALEQEGLKISITKGRKEKTRATLHNQEIGFTLLEKIDHPARRTAKGRRAEGSAVASEPPSAKFVNFGTALFNQQFKEGRICMQVVSTQPTTAVRPQS